ncbi:hypothetical protein [Cytobacillus horneckiae]|uniref:hypothetical protein n=1 Tax=Cytobacillus horneckiae TaxID=549687 RepID=UPI000A54AA74|nr:hypothetical protein [Cytobacillus horneckiae]MEC1158696.1 hypothetical protein [Cytobacillus horneckiae]NRG46654.1 hypothetical protein [Bacillus sp. CRN 9]
MLFRNSKFIWYGMIVFTIVLFIFGFYVGKDIEEEEKKAAAHTQSNKDEESFSINQLESNENDNGQHQNENEEEHNHDHSHGEYELENPMADANEELEGEINQLTDYFSKEDISQAKEVSVQFIKEYYPFDGNKPSQNINDAKKYMSSALYDELKERVIRPTQTIFRKELKSFEVYEPYNPTDEYLTINVLVKGEIYDVKDNINKKEESHYSIKIINEDGKFKVDKYTLDTAY